MKQSASQAFFGIFFSIFSNKGTTINLKNNPEIPKNSTDLAQTKPFMFPQLRISSL